MREAVQEAPLLHMLDLVHNVLVPASARRRDHVLVKGKRHKHDNGKEIDGGAHGAHALGDLAAVVLAQVDALEAGLHEGRPEPADERKRRAEGQAAEGQRHDERLVITLEGVEEDGDTGGRDGDETEALGAGQRRGCHGCHGWLLLMAGVSRIIGMAGLRWAFTRRVPLPELRWEEGVGSESGVS
jgi:hypothetical protein